MTDKSTFKTALIVTVHCLVGCVIGEFLGLVIGVSLGLSPWKNMALATFLAFLVGLFLASRSIVTSHKITYSKALKIIWAGESASILAMEIAMNATDYWIGGVQTSSIWNPIFWIGLAAAIPVGYITALPVNYYLIRKHLKSCH